MNRPPSGKGGHILLRNRDRVAQLRIGRKKMSAKRQLHFRGASRGR